MTLLPVLASVVIIALAPWHRTPPRRPDDPDPVSRRGEPGIAAISDRLVRADLEVGPAVVYRTWMLSTVVGALSGAAISGRLDPVAAFFGGSLGVLVPVILVLARGDRASRRIVQSLPEMLELLARSLRGGADLRTALRDVAGGTNEAGRTLDSVLRRVAAGERLGEAMDRWVVDLGHRDATVVRAVIRLGDSTGGSMATALDRAAATIRERSALRSEIRALTSQSRSSAMVIALSPVAFLAVVAITDPKSSRVLFATNVGRLSLTGGLLLDGLGMLWMSRLTSAVDR